MVLLDIQTLKWTLLSPKGYRQAAAPFEVLAVSARVYNTKVKFHGSRRHSKSKTGRLGRQRARQNPAHFEALFVCV